MKSYIIEKDRTTGTALEHELKKLFDNYKIPEQEMTDEKRSEIQSFIKNVHRL